MRVAVLSIVVLNLVSSVYAWPHDHGANRPVKVAIYYETLCSDSGKFITDQFYPAYKTLRPLLSVEFVPYGKATHKKIYDRWVFKSQHGPLEYWGNKVQACMLAQRRGQDAEVEFVNCFMKLAPNQMSVNTCSKVAGTPYAELMQCVETPLGDELLAKYGDQTNKALPAVKYVPTIIFNDQYNRSIDASARRNFFETAMAISQGQHHMGKRKVREQATSPNTTSVEKISRRSLFYDIFGKMKKRVYGSRRFKKRHFSSVY